MSESETGKQKASRIELDYHAKPDWVQRWRWNTGWLVFVVSIGVVVYACADHFIEMPGVRPATSHGPVADVHARWENRCEVCHQPFSPLRSDAAPVDWIDRQTNQTWGEVASAKCQVCHGAADHHPNAHIANDTESCSSCHREHLGRKHPPTEVADAGCLRCHGELDQHRRPSDAKEITPPPNHISAFHKDHPPFPSLLHDPGTIQFTHDRHLSKGLVPSTQDKMARKTWADYPDLQLPLLHPDLAKQAEHERGTIADAPAATDATPMSFKDEIQLSCNSCHQLDPSQSLQDNVRADGRYMQPINYDKHCKACHAGDLKLVERGGGEQRIEHKLQGESLDAQLTSIALKRVLEDQPAAKELLLQAALPGSPRDPQLDPYKSLLSEKVRALAEELQSGKKPADEGQADATKIQIQQGCVKCHQMQSLSAGSLPTVVPTGIPTVWFQHAEFDHTAHRALDCNSCHGKATSSDRSSDVLIDKLESCIRCHQPPTAKGAGGIRWNCVTCHVYHVGDGRSHGRASPLLPPQQRLPIDTFLKGNE